MHRRPQNPIANELGMTDYDPRVDRKRVKLLVIDDQPSYGATVKEHVELCNYQYDISCEVAESGERALELMKSWEPTVVLVDVHMPGIDCFALLDRWKGGSSSIIVTSKQLSRDIEGSVLAHGADAYIQKSEYPEDVDRLLDQIAHIAPPLVERH